MRCPTCATENDQDSKFCMTCGTPLGSDATPPPGEPEDMSPSEMPPPPPADAPPPPPPADAPPPPPTDDAPPPPPTDDAPPPPPPADAPPPPPPAAPAPPDMPPPPVQEAWNPPPPAPSAQPPAPAPPAPETTGVPPAPAAWGAAAAPQPPAQAQWQQPAPGAAPAQWNQPMHGGPPQMPAGPPDPNGLGAVVGRLGNRARKDSKTAVAVAAVSLDDGEYVEALVAGRHQGHPAALLLTDRGLLLVDERPWKPHVERIEVTPDLQVHGMQDRSATLTLTGATQQWIVDQIADGPLAVEMAQRVRYRTSTM